jgi:hypothetical protein
MIQLLVRYLISKTYLTDRDTVIEHSIYEGKPKYMKEGGKPLFTNEKEVEDVIVRLGQKGVMWTTGNYYNGFLAESLFLVLSGFSIFKMALYTS